MSRTIFAVLLGVGLAVAAGCGSKEQPPPQQPDQPLTPTPNPTPGPNPEPGKKDSPPAPLAYDLDPAKHAIPAAPVSGVLLGEKVLAEVRLDGRLVLAKPSGVPGPDWQIGIDLPPEAMKGEPFKLVVGPDKDGAGLTVTYPRPLEVAKVELEGDAATGFKQKVVGWEKASSGFAFPKGFSLTLDLGKRANGKVPGRLYLALPEMQAKDTPPLRDAFAGTFEAVSLRQPTDPPGPDDLPAVSGTVTVRGAAADATVVVGYAANPTPELFPLSTTESRFQEATAAGGWVRADYDKPRVTFLSPGNGKDVPGKYEHSKLAPGRYLVYARIKDGPAAAKWVDVKAGMAHAADLVVDAAQTGGVEITVPVEVLGKVQMVPTDEPGTPPLDPALFTAITWQLGLERDIVARKAVYKGVTPGRYEVRAGGRSKVVEIVAGKTAELDLEKKDPEPPKKDEPKKEPEKK